VEFNFVTSSESKDEVEGGFLLNVVIRECTAILELLACKDEPLLVWRDAFLVLNLGLDVLNGVRWFNLEGDGLASKCLHKDLHGCEK